MRIRLCLIIVLLAASCGTKPPAEEEIAAPPFEIYRFDDHLAEATVSAPAGGSSVQMAEPIRWDFTDSTLDWKILRGRHGFRQGKELALQGRGGTPVIQTPDKLLIDWSLYETVAVRMIVERGDEIKIRIGEREFARPLAPPMRYQVYRFDLGAMDRTVTVPLAIMPTDDLSATVAIDYVELIPRSTTFTEPVGRQVTGKADEYRNVLYAHAPSSISYEVELPQRAQLHFGLGTINDAPVTFEVLAGPDGESIYSKTIEQANRWEDVALDLPAYDAPSTRIVLRTESAGGAVGLWANPLLTSAAPNPRPNVLFFTVCTLRPDHTSVYGYDRNTTPALSEFAASGVVFDDAHAQDSWTKGSFSSIMTSLYTHAHGLRNESDTLPASVQTLAERLRDSGYVTAGVVANPFAGRVTGLDRGFDYMVEHAAVTQNTVEKTDRGTDSAGINRIVLPWLEQHRNEPFFLSVLTADPHAPYEPPAEFEAAFANPAESAAFNKDYEALRTIRGFGGGAAVSQAEIRAKGIDPALFRKRAIDRYDAEIAHADRSFDQLMDKLQDLGVLDNTLVVVLSDHGEEFWEHGWSAHGHSLYEELIRAVLIMRHPGLLPGGTRIAEPVQLIDVAPTVLELLHLDRGGIMQGQSLAPLLRSEPFNRRMPVMSSRFPHPNASAGEIPEYRTATFARLDPDWKMIYRDQARKAELDEIELYDHRQDPSDSADVAARHPDLTGQFKQEIESWIEAQEEIRNALGPRGTSTLDPQTLERLRTLGYIGPGAKGP